MGPVVLRLIPAMSVRWRATLWRSQADAVMGASPASRKALSRRRTTTCLARPSASRQGFLTPWTGSQGLSAGDPGGLDPGDHVEPGQDSVSPAALELHDQAHALARLLVGAAPGLDQGSANPPIV